MRMDNILRRGSPPSRAMFPTLLAIMSKFKLYETNKKAELTRRKPKGILQQISTARRIDYHRVFTNLPGHQWPGIWGSIAIAMLSALWPRKIISVFQVRSIERVSERPKRWPVTATDSHRPPPTTIQNVANFETSRSPAYAASKLIKFNLDPCS
jgi:hypothetical protein